MDADESLSIVVNEGEQIRLLLVVHLERAAGVEEDGIEVVQVLGIVLELLLRQGLGVGANLRVPEPAFPAHPFDGRERVGDGLVSVPLLLADREQLLLRRIGGLRDGDSAGQGVKARDETESIRVDGDSILSDSSVGEQARAAE